MNYTELSPSTKPILSVEGTCDLLGCSRTYLRDLEKKNILIPSRLQGRVYYDLEQIKAAIFNPIK